MRKLHVTRGCWPRRIYRETSPKYVVGGRSYIGWIHTCPSGYFWVDLGENAGPLFRTIHETLSDFEAELARRHAADENRRATNAGC